MLSVSCFRAHKVIRNEKRLLQLAERLSQHEMTVWQQAGPYVQSVLVQQIRSLNKKLFDPLRPVLIKVLGEALRPEVRGTTSTYEAITLHQGVVIPSEALARLRTEAIGILKTLYGTASTGAVRTEVVNTLWQAALWTLHG
jgi:hypothetical protein